MTMNSTRHTRSSITQSQVRDLTSRQPLRSSAKKPRAALGLEHAGTCSVARNAALTRKVAPSMAMAPPAPMTRHQDAGHGRPDHPAEVVAHAHERVGLLEPCGRHDLRQDGAGRRPEEGLGGAVTRGEHGELPDLRRARQQQHGAGDLDGRADQVAGDHERAARQPVRPHAADQRQQDERDGLGGQHQPEVGARAGEVEHGERERHRGDAVAEHRDALGEEDVAEVARAQQVGALAEACGDEAGETHAPSLQGRGGRAAPGRGGRRRSRAAAPRPPATTSWWRRAPPRAP